MTMHDTIETIAVGTPVYQPAYGKIGYVCRIEESNGNTFDLSGGSMCAVRHELTIVWDDLTMCQVSEAIAGHWLTRAREAGLPMIDDAADRLQKAEAKEAERRRQAIEDREKAKDERAAFEADAAKRIPSWAKAVIVAEHHRDDCDSMTDYYNTVREKTVILGFSKHTRDLFPELRKAARNYPETAYLADADESAEHREKYSMGAGYYLKAEGRYRSGWLVRKIRLWGDNDPVKSLPTGEWSLAAPEPARAAQSVSGIRIEEHTHTKKGFQMFICILPGRVDREEFDRLRDLAQALGGWYSRPWGRTPGGFAFKDRAAAEAFANPTPTDSDINAWRIEPYSDDQGHTLRVCRRNGDSPADVWGHYKAGEEHIAQAALDRATAESKTPRANMAERASATTAERLRALADRMESDIAHKLGDRLANTPKRQREAATARIEGHRLQRTQQALRALADMHDAGTVPPELAGVRSKAAVYDLVGTVIDRSNSGYYDAGIDTGKPSNDSPAALALWSLIESQSAADREAEDLRRKVAALQFANIPGYFPTPRAIVFRMIECAEIPDDSPVGILEPSAGSGAILDVIRERFPKAELFAYERQYSLREVLQLKGYTLTGEDFTEAAPEPIFDRVLMNPPFEKGQDIEHVMHAYAMLRPGGRLVAIMSPGPFFRSDRKATEFREWFDGLGGEKEDLPPGSFKESGTGVGAVIVTLHA